MFSAIGSTSVAVSSGLLAWQFYQTQLAQKAQELQQQQQKPMFEDLSRVQYININSSHWTSPTGSPVSKYNSPIDIEMRETFTKAEDLMCRVPRHLRKSWRLLHQANEGSYEQHIKAVQALSKLSLNDAEYNALAQACEPKTAVGLARTSGVDPRFFLSPPPMSTELRETALIELFRDILMKLPADSEQVHECIKYFTSTALDNYLTSYEEEVIDSDISYEFHRESHHIHSIPRPRIGQETLVEYCLQALLSHSTMVDQCQVIIDSMTLQVLFRVVQDYPENPRIKSIIGKIISNISLHPEFHKAIFQSGWVGQLAQWKQHENILVSMPAIKALCNLDQEYTSHKYEPGIYLMLPNDRHVQHTNNLSNVGVDVVFIHGLMGGVFYTWRQFDPDNLRESSDTQISEDDYSYCWPRDWLQEDSNHVRVIGCDFDSYISQWGGSCPTQSFNQSLKERSEDMLKKLQQAGVGKRPVIFVGHSMGGLIIKQILTRAQESEEDSLKDLVNNTKGVVFYSTPHDGSQIASLSKYIKLIFFPSVEVQELEPNNPTLATLNRSFKDFVYKFKTKVISFGETQPTRHLGVDITFVPHESSNPGFGEFYSVPFNHINICKPNNRKSILFRKFYNLLWDTLDDVSSEHFKV